MKIDLHTHSSCSDGTFTPKELVEYAKEKGVSILSLTDHDSIEGVSQAKLEGEKLGIKVLNGVEISSYSSTEIHILGYNFDENNSVFLSHLHQFALQRKERADNILDKLERFNIYLDRTQLQNIPSVGRMHIAKMLVAKGHCQNIPEAFDKYLGANGVAYFPSKRISPSRAVEIIRDAGGIAVIAHPLRLLQQDKLEDLIVGLLPIGLGGLEVYYPTHDQTQSEKLLEIAKKYRLIATGGTDFHGANKNVELGSLDYYMEKFTRKKLGLLRR